MSWSSGDDYAYSGNEGRVSDGFAYGTSGGANWLDARPATYSPVMICACGHSFHADAQEAHNAYWHGETIPGDARMATRAEHKQAGWDVTDYPRSIS